MKTKITILALLFFLAGITQVDAQKHHHKGGKSYAKQKHGYYSGSYGRNYSRYRPQRRQVVYVQPRSYRYYPRQYNRRVVYQRPYYPSGYYAPRPGFSASIYIP